MTTPDNKTPDDKYLDQGHAPPEIRGDHLEELEWINKEAKEQEEYSKKVHQLREEAQFVIEGIRAEGDKWDRMYAGLVLSSGDNEMLRLKEAFPETWIYYHKIGQGLL